MRLKIIRIIIIVFFSSIVATLCYMQMIQGSYYFTLSRNNRIRVVPLEGERGRIKDREGIILADNSRSYNVLLIPQEVASASKLFSFLSQTLGVAPNKLYDNYRNRKLTPFAPILVAENISREKAMVLEENRYRFPSLIIDESFTRQYPLGNNSAHVLGYVGKMNQARLEQMKEYGYSAQSLVGYSGVEEFYDLYLRADSGGMQIEVNSRGQQVRLLGLKPPNKGKDITLTIDSKLQQNGLQLLGENRGTIIVMDLDNGEILSLVSSPSFDPNVFLNDSDNKRLNIFRSNDSPLLNRAIKGLYPPGSVFKIPVALCALESQKVNPQTRFNCEGFLELGGIRFGCTHNHGSQNMIEAIAHSCNVYFYHLGRIVGGEPLSRYAHLLGLGSPTLIDLPYEESGKIPSPSTSWLAMKRRWYAGDTLNFSIGQGDVLTTPLQVTQMMSIVANNGEVVHPHLIKSIGNDEVTKFSVHRHIKLNKQFLDAVQKGMRSAVTEYSGTAHALDIDGIFIAGKTGTAQSSGDRPTHAWFVGYANGPKRRVAFSVFLEFGGSSYNACLLGRELVLFMQREKII